MKAKYLLLFALSLPLMVFAQGRRDVIEIERLADDYYSKFNFHSALPLYVKLDSLKPNNKDIMYKAGVCYINEFDENNAFKYFSKCLEKPEDYPTRLYFYLGKTEHLRHNFDQAITHYNTFVEKLGNPKKYKYLLDEVNREIEICKYAKEMVASPVDLKVKSLGEEINSEFPEYGPVLSADEKEIIFTSNRPGTTGGKKDPYDGKYYEDIYISTKDQFGKWSKPVQVSPNINTDGHDASISLTPDGQQLIIYHYSEEAGNSGDLYFSELQGDVWSKAKKLSENINSEGWEPSASLAEDGRVMYFASSRPGGLGGTDIYMVKKLPNGEWALPQNLGPTINTKYDEDSPFIHPDGESLYFSSNGHKGIGGHDIFVSTIDPQTKKWGAPKNIGYPLNTAQDDLHFTWSVDGKRVYFASKRADGKGDQDIYYAEINRESSHVLLMTGIVHEVSTQKMIESIIKITEKDSGQEVGVFHSNKSTGKFVIVLHEGKNYMMSIEAEGYQTYEEELELADLHQYEESNRDFPLVPKQ